jgi:hypothetical protein
VSGTEREARLRPEYAELYGELAPNLWMPARELAAILVQRARIARGLSLHQRTLDPRHFEFRGGAPERRPPGQRTRRTDAPGGDPTR